MLAPVRPSLRLVSGLLLLLLAGCSLQGPGLSYSTASKLQMAKYSLRGNTAPVHDPSLIRQGGIYYAFTSDPVAPPPGLVLPIRCSPDLLAWSLCGSVFSQVPAWLLEQVPGVRSLWAPDISFFNGLYHLYYAASTAGSQRSLIALATNTTLDSSDPGYHWQDRGAVLGSQPGMDFNAIDPNILTDTDGSVYLTYGSYWSGIKQVQIDPATGLPLAGAKRYSLAARPGLSNDPIEGASIVHHGQYYYLFVSVDFCCEPVLAADNYKEAVGRGLTPHGPFTDEAGTAMMRGGGTVLLEGNGAWNAPGGGTAYIDGETGQSLLTFHALDMQENGQTHLWVSNIDWQTGWPVLGPPGSS